LLQLNFFLIADLMHIVPEILQHFEVYNLRLHNDCDRPTIIYFTIHETTHCCFISRHTVRQLGRKIIFFFLTN
jgi:hypothetical protein